MDNLRLDFTTNAPQPSTVTDDIHKQLETKGGLKWKTACTKQAVQIGLKGPMTVAGAAASARTCPDYQEVPKNDESLCKLVKLIVVALTLGGQPSSANRPPAHEVDEQCQQALAAGVGMGARTFTFKIPQTRNIDLVLATPKIILQSPDGKINVEIPSFRLFEYHQTARFDTRSRQYLGSTQQIRFGPVSYNDSFLKVRGVCVSYGPLADAFMDAALTRPAQSLVPPGHEASAAPQPRNQSPTQLLLKRRPPHE
jgi:hypothetical protein